MKLKNKLAFCRKISPFQLSPLNNKTGNICYMLEINKFYPLNEETIAQNRDISLSNRPQMNKTV